LTRFYVEDKTGPGFSYLAKVTRLPGTQRVEGLVDHLQTQQQSEAGRYRPSAIRTKRASREEPRPGPLATSESYSAQECAGRIVGTRERETRQRGLTEEVTWKSGDPVRRRPPRKGHPDGLGLDRG
jgi:hypothetical protein